jgi:hypothetical protein
MILPASAGLALGQATKDWSSGLPREPIHVKAWPEGKKVAICFVLYVEVWGYGHGPNLRPDMVARDPDVVDESFRQYAIEWGIPRVGKLFKEQAVPLSIALNADFPEQFPEVWKQFRASVPNAPIVAHGINNSTQLLPLGRGLDDQRPTFAAPSISSKEHGRALARMVEPERVSQRRYLPRPRGRGSVIRWTAWTPMSLPPRRAAGRLVLIPIRPSPWTWDTT